MNGKIIRLLFAVAREWPYEIVQQTGAFVVREVPLVVLPGRLWETVFMGEGCLAAILQVGGVVLA